jgi:hypothetical protein
LAVRCANASTAADRSTPLLCRPARLPEQGPAQSHPRHSQCPGRTHQGAAQAPPMRQQSGASCSSNGSRTSAHAATRTSSCVRAGSGLIWSMLRSLPDGLGMSRSLTSRHCTFLNVGCWARPR